MNVLISAAAFLVAIGILVAVHEYGHFIAARLLGVRVLRFSIGFGRPLWMRRTGPDRTEFCVSAIPFGGYVKLLDERDCAVSLAEQPRAFNRQPIPSRIIIMAAGPVLNFLFAIVAYWVMFMVGVPGMRPVIGEVESASIAAEAGLRTGDRVIAVGGQSAATWEGVIVAMLDGMLSADRIVLRVQGADAVERSVTLDTRGRAAELTEPGRLFTGLGFEAWTPKLPAVIGEVLAGGAAERAGLQAGDLILGADGKDIETWPEWVQFVRDHPGASVEVQIERAGEPVQISVAVERAQSEDAPGEEIGRIGASPRIPADLFAQLRAVERYGPVRAFTRSLERSWEMTSLTVRMIARMITGDVSVKNISGPINIAQYAGYSASIGVAPFLSFLAVVSLSLGILNLLPVPMLDGGQIAYQLIEAAKGSPLSERSQLIGQQIGIFLLLVLMSFAFYNDISRLLG